MSIGTTRNQDAPRDSAVTAETPERKSRKPDEIVLYLLVACGAVYLFWALGSLLYLKISG